MPIADSQATLWHRGNPRPLLPSGPDGVYGTTLHRTRLSAIDIQHWQGTSSNLLTTFAKFLLSTIVLICRYAGKTCDALASHSEYDDRCE